MEVLLMGGSGMGAAVAGRAVLYVRISDDPAGSERGVDRQEADCRALAAASGWEVARVFRENDTSAFKQKTITLPSGQRVRRVVRPEFRAMLGWFAEGLGDVMVAYDLDRAVRDPRDLEDLIEARTLHGFKVRSVTGSLRLDTDSDVAMARVLVAMANKSSADTARRVARAARAKAEDGQWHGGWAPFGYKAVAGRLVVDPERAGLLLEAVDRMLAGESLYQVRCDWNKRGLTTARGKPWSERALDIVLRNPASKGVCAYRPVRADGTRDRAAAVEAEAVWEPVLDADTWARLQAVLDSRRASQDGWRKSNKRVWAFSGLIRCSKCGTAMRKQGPNYACTAPKAGVCRRSVNAAEVNELIEQAVLSVFASVALKPGGGPRGARGGALDALRRSLDADREALDRLDDDHYDGLIDKRAWARQRARVSERMAARQREWAAIQPPSVLGAGIDVATVADEWAGRTAAWRHDAAALVLEAVLVHAHPEGVWASAPRYGSDTPEVYAARQRAYREGLLARRVEFVWKA
ncbi:MAG: recombinase family protein [Bifidobacteriaceae bacterium]|jgi:DNA invertase Pin-like site-specific DNA recombinase|nr:recombinase family protein [Bifidobacteriaceae bacterium]